MKFLSISPVSPYDGIGHAGGKTYNYYLKNMSKKIDVNALLFCPKNEEDKTDLSEYQIDYKNIFTSGTVMTNISHIIFKWVIIFKLHQIHIFCSSVEINIIYI